LVSSNNFLRLHHYESVSQANGPGNRAVIWMQGCTLACPGCYNPQTHPKAGGKRIPPEALLRTIIANTDLIEGITISGGEPFQQITPLLYFLELIKQLTDYSVVVFSGYSIEEINKMPATRKIDTLMDVLIAGRYQHHNRLASRLLGSSNKTMHFFSQRYSASDFEQLPTTELTLNSDGEIIFSGIDPIRWETDYP
jgi:anaerobic ribonucleoside-triphosphate reductase activating protein